MLYPAWVEGLGKYDKPEINLKELHIQHSTYTGCLKIDANH